MDIPPEASKAFPGALGALSAVLLMKEKWQRGVLMVAPAVVLSYYAAEFVAKKTSMPEGLSGYLLGMFGMAAAAKVLETWEKFDLSGILGDFVRKILGLPKEEKKP